MHPRLQDLPPEHARLCLDAERFLRDELDLDPAGTTVLAAVSGGLDSTALLLVLCCLSQRLGITLCAAHMDHGLRPESGRDAEAARDLCRKFGVDCILGRADVAALAREQGAGLEEAGRQARYAFLEQARVEAGADVVATGHQLDDLAEDVLMRLLRGTGWPGLGGMEAWDPDRRLVRPLLLTPRAALQGLVRGQGLAWREDASNADPAFLRNRVRHDVLPLFLRENPNFLASVAGLWRLARLDRDLFQALAAPLLDQAVRDQGILLPAPALAQAHEATRLRACKLALESLGPGQPLLDGLRGLDRAWREGRTGKVFQFPGSKTAEVTSEGILFFAKQGPGGSGSSF